MGYLVKSDEEIEITEMPNFTNQRIKEILNVNAVATAINYFVLSGKDLQTSIELGCASVKYVNDNGCEVHPDLREVDEAVISTYVDDYKNMNHECHYFSIIGRDGISERNIYLNTGSAYRLREKNLKMLYGDRVVAKISSLKEVLKEAY